MLKGFFKSPSKRFHESKKRSQTTLESALVECNPKDVKSALKKRPAPVMDLADSSGMLPLHAAVLRGSQEVIKMVLTAGAEVNSVNEAGQTALIIACSSGRSDAADVVKFLLDNQADVTKNTPAGRTPLEEALLHHNEECVALLEPLVSVPPNYEAVKKQFQLDCQRRQQAAQILDHPIHSSWGEIPSPAACRTKLSSLNTNLFGDMLLVPVSVLSQHQVLPRKDEVEADLVRATDLPEGALVGFLSHRWLRPHPQPQEANPDDGNGTKRESVVDAAAQWGASKGVSDLSNIFLWVDYCCCEQRTWEGEEEAKEHNKTATSTWLYIACADAVITLENMGYWTRGWCRAEQLVAQRFGRERVVYRSEKVEALETGPEEPRKGAVGSKDDVRVVALQCSIVA